jgi:hypothetical protein
MDDIFGQYRRTRDAMLEEFGGALWLASWFSFTPFFHNRLYLFAHPQLDCYRNRRTENPECIAYIRLDSQIMPPPYRACADDPCFVLIYHTHHAQIARQAVTRWWLLTQQVGNVVPFGWDANR